MEGRPCGEVRVSASFEVEAEEWASQPTRREARCLLALARAAREQAAQERLDDVEANRCLPDPTRDEVGDWPPPPEYTDEEYNAAGLRSRRDRAWAQHLMASYDPKKSAAARYGEEAA